MKIAIRQEEQNVTVERIQIGECFASNGTFFIKTDKTNDLIGTDTSLAVELTTGKHRPFLDGSIVTRKDLFVAESQR